MTTEPENDIIRCPLCDVTTDSQGSAADNLKTTTVESPFITNVPVPWSKTEIPIPVRLALNNFLQEWVRSGVADDIAIRLTCREATALAGLFAATGHELTATSLIDAHSEVDDCGDWHCSCGDCG